MVLETSEESIYCTHRKTYWEQIQGGFSSLLIEVKLYKGIGFEFTNVFSTMSLYQTGHIYSVFLQRGIVLLI